MNERRIYGKESKISSNEVLKFYEKRATKYQDDLTVVTLSTDPENIKIRNDIEKELFLPLFDLENNTKVLEVGCGLGRFAENIQDHVKEYLGVDFSTEIIKIANNKFTEYSNIKFMVMEASEISQLKKISSFDLIFCMGFMMYLNDDDIIKLLNNYINLSSSNSSILFKESVSLMNERLTLKEFFSDKLNDNYNAIYRTKEEYEALFNSTLIKAGYTLHKHDLLLKKVKETGEMFWFFKRIK